MIKLLISDIGGVLIKTDEAILSSIETVLRQNQISPGSRTKLLAAFGTSLYDYIKNYLPDGYEDEADRCYDQFKRIYPHDVGHLMTVFDGVDETLKLLKA